MFKLRPRSDVKTSISTGNKSKNIVVYNPAGKDSTMIALSLAKQAKEIAAAKGIIVEFPCIGIPRLAYNVFVEKDLDVRKEQSIDQLLVDYERDDLKSLEDYIVKGNDLDLLAIYPKSKPDLPTLLKLNQNKTLVDVPQLLKQRLCESYNQVWFALQGQLIHPMTLISLKQADVIVMVFSDVSDLVWSYAIYKKLIEDYGINNNRILWYSEVKNHEFKAVPVYGKGRELLLKINEMDLGDNENAEIMSGDSVTKHIGVINPIEYLNYQAETFHLSAEISTSDNEKLKQLIDEIRLYLRDNHIDEYVKAIIDEESRGRVCYYIADYIKEQNDLKINMELSKVIRIVQKEITEMGVLQPALDDPRISSIEINSPDEVIVERDGITEHDEKILFQDVDHMHSTINKMLMPMGKTLTANEPIIDSNYRGFRINIILEASRGGVSANYPIISIRKFPPDVYSNDACIKYGNLNQEIIDFKTDVLACMPNTQICGGTNSGKTSSLLRFPLFMDRLDRILTVEDSEEMMLKSKTAYRNYPNIASLLVKWHELKERRVDLPKLIKATLRQNPDVIMIGEVRDTDAAEQTMTAANTGHMIAYSVHANSAAEGASRMVELLGDTKTAARRVGSTLDLIFFQEYVDGKRVITEIAELIGFKGENEPELNYIFRYNFTTGQHERVGGLKKLIPKMRKTYRNKPEVLARWCAME